MSRALGAAVTFGATGNRKDCCAGVEGQVGAQWWPFVHSSCSQLFRELLFLQPHVKKLLRASQLPGAREADETMGKGKV